MVENGLTAYILAGGRSRRMGVDKLFLQVGGRSLLERTIATCEQCFREVKLVAGSSDKFLLFNKPVVTDSPRADGPMAGVIAAIEDCDGDHCFVTASDLFDLRGEIIEALITEYTGQQYLGVRESGGIQPLCGIYHTSVLAVLYYFARNGVYNMTKFVHALAYDAIDIPDGRWRNINSPDDLAIGGLDG